MVQGVRAGEMDAIEIRWDLGFRVIVRSVQFSVECRELARYKQDDNAKVANKRPMENIPCIVNKRVSLMESKSRLVKRPNVTFMMRV